VRSLVCVRDAKRPDLSAAKRSGAAGSSAAKRLQPMSHMELLHEPELLTPEEARGELHAPGAKRFVRAGEAGGGLAAPPIGSRVGGEPASTDVRKRDAVFRRLLGVADVLAAGSALLVVFALSSGYQLMPAAVLALPFVVVLSKLLGLYDRDELLLHKATLDEAPGIFQLATLFSIFVWLLESAMIDGGVGKPEFVALWAVTFAGALAGRATARGVADRVAPSERCLLLGSPQAFRLMKGKLALRGGGGAQLVARRELEDPHGNAIAAGAIEELVRVNDVHRVILVPEVADSDTVMEAIREAKAIRVKISLVPRVSEVLGSSVVFDDLHGISVLGVRCLGLGRSSRTLKRGFDLLVSALGLVVTAPLLAVTALAIKLDSGGPVLFRQTRVGRGSMPFEILKFRTMVPEAEELHASLEHLNEADGLFKISADPRLTRVGRFLRRLSLDELPQLLNVLRGDMSVVGPRPLVAEDDSRVVGWHRQRLDLAPGMTGHWQVLGSSRIPLQEMVAIDYLYVANWSLWADLKYVLRTVPYVLRARGV